MGAVTGGRGIFFLEIGRDLELFLIDILSWAFREDEKKKRMHRALSARWLNRALSISEATTSAGVPLFLCPAVGYTSRWSRKPLSAQTSRPTICARRYNHTEAATTTATTTETPTIEVPVAQDMTPSRKLPLTCSGCGSFSQTNDAQQFGYFDVKSRRVKKWLSPKSFEKTREATEEDSLVDDVLKKLDASQLEALGLDTSKLVSGQELDGETVDGECSRWYSFESGLAV